MMQAYVTAWPNAVLAASRGDAYSLARAHLTSDRVKQRRLGEC